MNMIIKDNKTLGAIFLFLLTMFILLVCIGPIETKIFSGMKMPNFVDNSQEKIDNLFIAMMSYFILILFSFALIDLRNDNPTSKHQKYHNVVDFITDKTIFLFIIFFFCYNTSLIYSKNNIGSFMFIFLTCLFLAVYSILYILKQQLVNMENDKYNKVYFLYPLLTILELPLCGYLMFSGSESGMLILLSMFMNIYFYESKNFPSFYEKELSDKYKKNSYLFLITGFISIIFTFTSELLWYYIPSFYQAYYFTLILNIFTFFIQLILLSVVVFMKKIQSHNTL